MTTKEEHELQELLLDFTTLPNLESAIDNAFNKIDGRISYIIDNAQVRGTPLVRMIMQYTDDPEDLAMLSRALGKIAELLPKLNEIQEKRSLIKGISQEKNWLATQLGNFSQDIEKFIQTSLDKEGA